MKRWRTAFWILMVVTLLLAAIVFVMLPRANAATNISSSTTEHFAWDDGGGWWDFFNSNTISVSVSRMIGYASSTAIKEISFDCSTSPNGNICASSNYGVCNGLAATHQTDGTCTNYDASGWLSGYAWNDAIGWISLSCRNAGSSCGVPGNASYWGVTIDKTSGVFSGYAWNDVTGWISFNCSNTSSCGTSDYKVITSYRATSTISFLDSAIVDTQSVGGATLNSITWDGVQNANGTAQQTYVDFQIAASNSSTGPWNFIGPSGTSNDYYSATCDAGYRGGVNTGGNAPIRSAICIDPTQVKNLRYLKYRVRLRSDTAQTDTPRVDSIVLNWGK